MFYVLHSQSAMCNDHVSGTSGNLVTPLALFLFLLLFAWPDFFNRPKSSFFLLTEFLGREEKRACLGKSRDGRPTVSPVTLVSLYLPLLPNLPMNFFPEAHKHSPPALSLESPVLQLSFLFLWLVVQRRKALSVKACAFVPPFCPKPPRSSNRCSITSAPLFSCLGIFHSSPSC